MTLFLLILVAILTYYFLIYRDDVKNKFGMFSKKKCPNCHNPIEESFSVCPICKETLKRKCKNCGEKVDVSWKYCPYCEEPVDGSGSK